MLVVCWPAFEPAPGLTVGLVVDVAGGEVVDGGGHPVNVDGARGCDPRGFAADVALMNRQPSTAPWCSEAYCMPLFEYVQPEHPPCQYDQY